MDFHVGSPPSHGGGSKKKFKFNHPLTYIIGGVIIVGYLIIKSRQQSAQQAANANTQSAGTLVSYPSQPQNGVDVTSQLQSFQDSMQQDTAATLTAFSQQVSDQIAANQKSNQDALTATQKANAAALAAATKAEKDALSQSQNAFKSAMSSYQSQIGSTLSKITGQISSLEKSHSSAPTPKPVHHTTHVTHQTHPKPTPHPVTHTYTVRRGDTLSGIAEKTIGNYYHGGKERLFKLNPFLKKNPNLIHPGQKIHY